MHYHDSNHMIMAIIICFAMKQNRIRTKSMLMNGVWNRLNQEIDIEVLAYACMEAQAAQQTIRTARQRCAHRFFIYPIEISKKARLPLDYHFKLT